GAEGLRTFDDIGAGRIFLTGNFKARFRALYLHAGVEQHVDELGRGEEIRLACRNDEAARVAPGRIAEEALEFVLAAAPPQHTSGGRACYARGFYNLRSDRPTVMAAALDGVVAHKPDVVEELLAMARGIIEHGLAGRHGVIDRLPEMPRLRSNGVEIVGPGQLLRRIERNLHGRRM